MPAADRLIVLIDIDLVSKTGGIRFLLHALGDGPLELAPILASVFLHIADSPRTRAYLRLGSDLEVWRVLGVIKVTLLTRRTACPLSRH